MKNNGVKRLAFYVLLFLVVASIFLFDGTKQKVFSATYTDYLDTVCDITVISNSDNALKICEEYLEFADNEFSAADESSALYDYNHYQKGKPSEELLNLISIGKEFTESHPEYFSIYLDEAINLWNISKNPDTIPTDSDIKNALKNNKVNLGAIAKGYITDSLVKKLHENNVASALINLGGNTYAIGKKPTGENWKIGIQDPKDESNIIGSITAENIAVVTSGDYQRYVEIDGTRYHHILDPKTGYPANSGVHSVTVICKDATTADALSTAAFVAGIEEGHKLLKEYDAIGIFITDDTIYFSKEMENIFKQMDFSYKYKFLY